MAVSRRSARALAKAASEIGQRQFTPPGSESQGMRDGAWHPTEPSAVRFPSRLMMSGCGPNAESGLAPNLSGHRIKPEVVGPRPYDAIDPRKKSAVNKASFQFPHRIKGEAGALSHR